MKLEGRRGRRWVVAVAVVLALAVLVGGSYAWAEQRAASERIGLAGKAQAAAEAVSALYQWGYVARIDSRCPSPDQSQSVPISVPPGQHLTPKAVDVAWLPGCDLYYRVDGGLPVPPSEAAATRAAAKAAGGASAAVSLAANRVTVTLTEKAPGVLGLVGQKLAAQGVAEPTAPKAVLARGEQELAQAAAVAENARVKPEVVPAPAPEGPKAGGSPGATPVGGAPVSGPSVRLNCAALAQWVDPEFLPPECKQGK